MKLAYFFSVKMVLRWSGCNKTKMILVENMLTPITTKKERKLFEYKNNMIWEGHKILRNLHQLFVLCAASQIIGGD